MRAGAVLALVAVVAAGCSSGDGGSGDADGGGGSGALASLVVIDTEVDVNDTTGTEGQELAVGDTIATNPQGFGEVAYFDGSVTRVAQAAEFTVTALSDEQGDRRVEATLDTGTSWNRVEELSGTDGAYTIDTPVAQATATGTAFAIDCTNAPDSCTFTAVEGTIEITPTTGDPVTLDAPATIEIVADQPPPAPDTLTDDDLAQDDWITTNLELDAENLDTDGDGDADDGSGDGEAFPGTYEVTVIGQASTLECTATECTLDSPLIDVGPFPVEGNRVSGSVVETFTAVEGSPTAEDCPAFDVTYTIDATVDADGVIEGTFSGESAGCGAGGADGSGSLSGERTD